MLLTYIINSSNISDQIYSSKFFPLSRESRVFSNNEIGARFLHTYLNLLLDSYQFVNITFKIKVLVSFCYTNNLQIRLIMKLSNIVMVRKGKWSCLKWPKIVTTLDVFFTTKF